MLVLGKCCAYCKNNDTPDCPVKSADPWSRWKNFCNEFDEIDNIPRAKQEAPKCRP